MQSAQPAINERASVVGDASAKDLHDIARCPQCLSKLRFDGRKPVCTNAECSYAHTGFPTAAGQPVLVDFEQSVFDRANYNDDNDAVPESGVQFAGSFRTYTNHTLRDRFRAAVFGHNQIAEQNGIAMLRSLKARVENPRLLIIGGGAWGSGVNAFYQDASVRITSIDVYPSPYTHLLADAHALPFANEAFDGVWIQAVLEHVLDPHVVVGQIHRVLRPEGLVYAETPFMQQVHEGAHDFTRFTFSGHRWLFRSFDQVEAGTIQGTGSGMIWAIRYFWRAFGVGDKASTLLAAPWFWLRYLDRLMPRDHNTDSAMSFFFLGRKSDRKLSPKEIKAYYRAA